MILIENVITRGLGKPLNWWGEMSDSETEKLKQTKTRIKNVIRRI